MLNKNIKAFVIDITYWRAKISIYLAYEAQITLLLTKNVTILDKYLNFANVFLKKSAIKLSKYCNINENAINLKSNK